jgi:hypothetical protein
MKTQEPSRRGFLAALVAALAALKARPSPAAKPRTRWLGHR